MRTNKINTRNFENTVLNTVFDKNVNGLTYYLDKHSLKGVVYYTLSQDENLLSCWDSLSEAKTEYNNK